MAVTSSPPFGPTSSTGLEGAVVRVRSSIGASFSSREAKGTAGSLSLSVCVSINPGVEWIDGSEYYPRGFVANQTVVCKATVALYISSRPGGKLLLLHPLLFVLRGVRRGVDTEEKKKEDRRRILRAGSAGRRRERGFAELNAVDSAFPSWLGTIHGSHIFFG